MVRNKLFYIVAILSFGTCVFGQTEAPTDTIPDKEKDQVTAMVGAVEYYFNLLGSKRTTSKEKETIINESFTKLFRDGKVQIEDDLQEERSTQIFKDVQAYLKDVDFFFQQVVFNFQVNSVERLYTADSTPYFKADIIRNLTATDIEGDTLNISGPRFIEFNFDKPGGELKVVSIYTKKVDREKQLKFWWENLTLGWKKIFQDEIGIYDDSLTTDELTRIAGMDSLDLADNDQIISLEPIYVLTELSYLKLSNSWVSDLSPLTAINSLKVLDVSNSSVHDLSVLKYHTGIEQMVLFNSHVKDFSVLESFSKLKMLDLRDASALDLTFIGGLYGLVDLNLSGTSGVNGIDFSGLLSLQKLDLQKSDVATLNGFESMRNLKELNLTETGVDNLESLTKLNALEILQISNTQVASIQAVTGLGAMKKLYVDGLTLAEPEVDQFIKENPKALLIRNIEELSVWWEALSVEWKTVFTEQLNLANPTKEELVLLLNLTSLDANNSGIRTLKPLSQLKRLSYLNVSDNNIKSLEGIEGLKDLEIIKLNNTNVTDLSPLNGLPMVASIEAINTAVRSLEKLKSLKSLVHLDVDGAPVTVDEVNKLLGTNQNLKVKFQSEALNSWWARLSDAMQSVFRMNISISGTPTSEELHSLTRLAEIEVSDPISVSDLTAFGQFYRLESLVLTRTGLSDLGLLPNTESLKSLSITESPLSDLSSVLRFKALTSLNISNTAVDDLRPLSVLTNLEELNCSGTNLRRLRGLEELKKLQKLDCSNTSINKLDRLYGLSELLEVICFNSRLKSNDIAGLKEAQPQVKIIYY